MAIPPMLALNARTSGAMQVVRILNGTTPVSVGGALPAPAALEATSANNSFQQNRVVHFKGDLYALTSQALFKHDKVADTWSNVHTLTSSGTLGYRMFGLFIMHKAISNTEILVLWRATGANTSYATYTEDGVSGFTNGPNWGVAGEADKSIVYRNTIVSVVSNSGLTWIVDPSLGTRVIVAAPLVVATAQAMDLCVFQNELYMLGMQSDSGGSNSTQQATAYPKLFMFEGGAWVAKHYMHTAQFSSGTYRTQCGSALWTDGTSLFAVYISRQDSLHAWKYQKIDVSGGIYTATDLDGDLPADWVGENSKVTVEASVEVTVDNETTPGTPIVHLWHLTNDIGGIRTYYELPAPGNNWPAGSSSVSTNYILSVAKMGGGESFWTTGDLSIGMASPPVPAVGAMTLSFIAHGDPVVLSHDIAGTGTIVVGDTVTGATSGATGTVVFINSTEIHIGGVTGTFANGEDIYETVDVNFVIASSAPSGGAADKIVKVYFDSDEEITQTQATLVAASATGGTAAVSSNTAGEEVINIIADGVTEYSVQAAVLTDGLSIGDNVNFAFRVTQQ